MKQSVVTRAVHNRPFNEKTVYMGKARKYRYFFTQISASAQHLLDSSKVVLKQVSDCYRTAT